MADITAIVLTKNEEANIVACLQSLAGFCSRVVVIDSGSTDGTVALARQHGAEVLSHAFTYYAAQFNWGIDNAGIQTRWTLRLDADERFTPAVCRRCEELMAAHAEDEVNGIVIESDFYFLGRLIKHGGSKKRKIMAFKTGIGRIEDRQRDAHTVLASGTSVAIQERFIHRDFKDLYSHIQRYNNYATRELADYLAFRAGQNEDVNTDKQLQKQRKKKFGFYYKAPMFLRSWLWFVYQYYFRLGFLDGREGYLYCFFENYWYRFLVDARIYEHDKARGEPDAGDGGV